MKKEVFREIQEGLAYLEDEWMEGEAQMVICPLCDGLGWTEECWKACLSCSLRLQCNLALKGLVAQPDCQAEREPCPKCKGLAWVRRS